MLPWQRQTWIWADLSSIILCGVSFSRWPWRWGSVYLTTEMVRPSRTWSRSTPSLDSAPDSSHTLRSCDVRLWTTEQPVDCCWGFFSRCYCLKCWIYCWITEARSFLSDHASVGVTWKDLNQFFICRFKHFRKKKKKRVWHTRSCLRLLTGQMTFDILVLWKSSSPPMTCHCYKYCKPQCEGFEAQPSMLHSVGSVLRTWVGTSQ